MKDQLQTIREAFHIAMPYLETHDLGDKGYIQKALTAVAQLEAMAGEQEPWPTFNDDAAMDGYLTDKRIDVFARKHPAALVRALARRIVAAPVAQQPQAEFLCESNDSPWLICKACAAEGKCKQQAEAAPAQAEPITEAAIDAYLEDYEMRGETEDGRDACYTPSEREKFLIKDAIMGLLAEVPLKQPQAESVPSASFDGVVPSAIRSYLRRCSSGGMSKKHIDIVQANVDEADRLGYFKLAIAETILDSRADSNKKAGSISKCVQCQKAYKAGSTTKGCPKCAPGVIVIESEFRKPIVEENGKHHG